MLVFARKPDVGRTSIISPDEEAILLRMEERLPPVLSVIAGMVDLTGFFMLGNIFTAHITGNLVVASALLKRIPLILKHSLRERNSWRIRLGLVVG